MDRGASLLLLPKVLRTIKPKPSLTVTSSSAAIKVQSKIEPQAKANNDNVKQEKTAADTKSIAAAKKEASNACKASNNSSKSNSISNSKSTSTCSVTTSSTSSSPNKAPQTKKKNKTGGKRKRRQLSPEEEVAFRRNRNKRHAQKSRAKKVQALEAAKAKSVGAFSELQTMLDLNTAVWRGLEREYGAEWRDFASAELGWREEREWMEMAEDVPLELSI